MILRPAGTAAHPYNIADLSSEQNWFPRAARERFLYIVTEHGSKPATAADVAAWRAVGSPSAWRFGGEQYGIAEQTFQTSGSPAQAFWQPRDEALGTFDNHQATFGWLQRLPATQAGLTAVIRRDALTGTGNVATADLASAMFLSAVWLLTRPVTPQVHATVYKVIAGLPWEQTAGIMTDPLGRRGYGVSMGIGGGEREVIVVSPSTGALLADEQVVATAGRTTVRTWSSACGFPHMLIANTAAQRAQIRKATPSPAVCARLARDGSRYVQYSPRYQGQVTSYDAYGQVGWTNTAPRLPAAQSGPAEAKG
jgi:hypothetical protein